MVWKVGHAMMVRDKAQRLFWAYAVRPGE
jgi:hypothetical protein